MKTKENIKTKIKSIKDSAHRKYVLINSSIRYRIIGLVTLTVMLTISIFGGYLYYFVQNNLINQSLEKEINYRMNEINDNLISKYRIIENSFNLFLYNQEIRSNLELLDSSEQTYYLKALTRLQIETQIKYSVMNDYGWNSGLLESVFIFETGENYFYLLDNYLPDEEVLQDHRKFYYDFYGPQYKHIVMMASQKYDTIYFMKDIKKYISKKSLGKMVLGVNEKSFADILNADDISKDYIAFIVNDENNIVFHTDRNKIGCLYYGSISLDEESNSKEQVTYNGEEYYVGTEKINDLGLTSVIMIPKKEINSKLNELIRRYIFIILLAIILTLIVSTYAASIITKPFTELTEIIENIKNENFKVKMGKYKYTELNEVSTTFNDMIDEIQYLFNEVYKKQILLKESELKALHAQINPHFLFNVLDTISWEAKMSHNDTITKMVNSLGELLRASFTFGSREKITIGDELKYVHFYLDLQNIRFGDKINVTINVEDKELYDLYLPKLSMQPLIENAIVHGIESKVGKGSLSINIFSKDSIVYINIIDDGVGFDSSKLNIDTLDEDTYIKQGRSHIGIVNVNQRIKIIYGEKFGIDIKSKINVGTEVLMKIPIDKGEA